MRAWLERSFRNRIFLTVLLVALVPLLLCDVLMTQVMIFRSEHTLRTDAQEEMALLTTQLDALLTDCGDVTRALAGSTVTRSALRRGGSDSRTLYQLLNRSTVALREYADFEVYGEDGDCLYTTANVWPAAQSTGWGILSAARAADGIVLRAGNGGLAGACPVTARGGAVLGYAVFRMDDANFDAFFAPLLRGADDLLLVDATWRLLCAPTIPLPCCARSCSPANLSPMGTASAATTSAPARKAAFRSFCSSRRPIPRRSSGRSTSSPR